MVSTSNWPPLVAMSVVTRWRSTFSSSVTHFTVMSGFLAVKSLVSPCMRIMSPLLTVAIVRVVSATEGTETKSAAAPTRAPRTFRTVTSHYVVLSIYPHVGLMFTLSMKLVKRRRALALTHALREAVRNPCDEKRRAAGERSVENGACRGFVGDQPIDQPPGKRRLDRRDLGAPDRGCDGGCRRRHLRRNAGEALVGAALDQPALGVVGPPCDLAHRT